MSNIFYTSVHIQHKHFTLLSLNYWVTWERSDKINQMYQLPLLSWTYLRWEQNVIRLVVSLKKELSIKSQMFQSLFVPAPQSTIILGVFETICYSLQRRCWKIQKLSRCCERGVGGSQPDRILHQSFKAIIVETNAFRPVLQAVIFLLPKINRLLFKPLIVEWMIQINASKHKLSYELLVGSIFCHRICSGIKRIQWYTFVEVYGYTLWNIVVTRTQTD